MVVIRLDAAHIVGSLGRNEAAIGFEAALRFESVAIFEAEAKSEVAVKCKFELEVNPVVESKAEAEFNTAAGSKFAGSPPVRMVRTPLDL